MKSKSIVSLVIMMLFTAALLSAAGSMLFISTPEESDIVVSGGDDQAANASVPGDVSGKRLVDLRADDAYYISKGDSTIFILVGNFAAHHNGAVIMADSAVRYSNQSFECFGNVLINQNSTYVYGQRAEYNNKTSVATVYSDLVKIIDGEAIIYTYDCKYNTNTEIGEFSRGCYVQKGNSLVESDRGYYNSKTHDLTAISRVEMRDDTYQMRGDSVIFNTQTENARYFTHSNIWNDKDEYLYTDAGTYTKATDMHHLTKNAYILSPEREIWCDTIEYYRTDGHIIGRRNIQMDDIEQNVKSFADYGEWWDEPGNALFTGRPSMVNYDTESQDSVYLSADTLWLYTIAVEPPVVEVVDSASMREDKPMAEGRVEDSNAKAEVPKDDRSAAKQERKEERKERKEERKEERGSKRMEHGAEADGMKAVDGEFKAADEQNPFEKAKAGNSTKQAEESRPVAAEKTPAMETARDEAPKSTEKIDAKVEQPKAEAESKNAEARPVVEQPKVEAKPAKEAPKADANKEPARVAAAGAPKTEAPKAETKTEIKAEAPKRETTPVAETPKTEAKSEPEVKAEEKPADVPSRVATPRDTTATKPGEAQGGYLTTMTLAELAERQSYLPEPIVKETPVDTTPAEPKQLTPKELRRKAKEDEKRRRDSIKERQLYLSDSIKGFARAERDSLRRLERIERDSLLAIEQAISDSLYKLKYGERDSLKAVERAVRDSLRRMEVDSLIAKRIERSSRLADEEKARMARVQFKVQEYQRKKIERAKARAARRGKEYDGPEFEDLFPDAITSDSLAAMEERAHEHDHGHDHGEDHDHDRGIVDSLGTGADSLRMGDDVSVEESVPFPADSSYKMVKAYRNVKMYRSDSQMICDSLITRNTDSIVHLYRNPILWNETNQITSDSMAIHTRNQKMEKAHFMGEPLMISEIDTMYYNQVKGKDMVTFFVDGEVRRNNVDGNAQTIYYLQEEDNPAVTGLMYIESSSISFYFAEGGDIDQIVYKQNPEYVLYPMDMIPESQSRRLSNFAWHITRRPSRDSILTRTIRPSQREDDGARRKPTFSITERINYDRRRLTENHRWIDRIDVLPPDVVEWRNSRPSYKNRKK